MHFVVLENFGVNLALNKPASQVSTWSDAVASIAVDGVAAYSACTLGHTHPWLSVDLAAQYDVGVVIVTNDAAIYRNYYCTHCCCFH